MVCTSGNSEAVGDFMASLPLGLLRSSKGAGELGQGKVWEGTKDVVGGAIDASQIPAAFIAPEAGEAATSAAGRASTKAGEVISAAKELAVPSTGTKIQVAKDAIRHVLGSKADADIVDEAYSRIGHQKLFSSTENEL